MTEEKQRAMTVWLDGRIGEREARHRALLADDRADEAAFEKIAGNVYDIFRTILAVAGRTCQGEVAVKRFFLRKMEEIPASWRASYQQAEQHGDGEKLHIEAIKLSAVEEIQTEFSKIWGEMP